MIGGMKVDRTETIKRLSEEAFVSHRAFTSEGSDHIGRFDTLEWRNPENGFHRMVFMLRGPLLIVYGDSGSAMYGWSGTHDFKWLKELDLDYFAGKRMTDRPKRHGEIASDAKWHFYGLQAALKWLEEAPNRHVAGLVATIEIVQPTAPYPPPKRPIEGCEEYDETCACEACSIKRGDKICACTAEVYPHPDCQIHGEASTGCICTPDKNPNFYCPQHGR